MRRPILLVLMSVTCLSACSPSVQVDTSRKAGPTAPVGLCVRTARDGYVVLEARVMQSSGDPKIDASVVKDTLDAAVARPNQRTWFEWLPMQVAYGDPGGGGLEATMPDCSGLDRDARTKAGAS